MTINPEVAEASLEIGRRLCDQKPDTSFELEILAEARQYVLMPPSVKAMTCRKCDAKYFILASHKVLSQDTFEEVTLCECIYTEEA
jgi:RNase P subunit RPR2